MRRLRARPLLLLEGDPVGVTSGRHQSWVDVDVVCGNPWCAFEGWTEACEDVEDMTFSWVCPVCEREHVDQLGEPPC